MRKDAIRKFVKENTFKEADKIQNDTLVFQEGFLDSMGLAMLVDFVEQSFGITTNDEDLIEDNFESINAIANFVELKLSSE